MIDFGRDICCEFGDATRREWLVTNGLGSYGCGTIAGALRRRYHGLLAASTAPPGRRVLLLAALLPELVDGAATIPLWTQEWGDGSNTPRGDRHLERFRLEDGVPVTTWAVGPHRLERRIWMRRHRHATVIRFTVLSGPSDGPTLLRLTALSTHRSHHATIPSPRPAPTIDPAEHGVRVLAHTGATALWIQSADGRVIAGSGQAWGNVLLGVERQRGYDSIDSHHHAATVEATLAVGQSITVVAGTESADELDGERLAAAEREHQQRTVATAGAPTDEFRRSLVLAADRFIVRRRFSAAPPQSPTSVGATAAPRQTTDGASIVAGYPWFEDWGRDTFIALPGLCLATGRVDEAAQIVRTFAAALDRGMLPNRFPDEGGAPEYHTVDATLWFVESAFRTAERLGPAGDALLRELLPTFGEILRWHVDGTRHGICVDPADGLLRAGEPGLQLTWMDAKIGDHVITPRIGKPVEIAALWYAGLCRLGRLARALGSAGGTAGGKAGAAAAAIGRFSAAELEQMAARAKQGFARFSNPATGCLFDVIDGPGGDDGSVRPNQVIAAGLPDSPVDDATAARIVQRCAATLLTSFGLRTLDPADPRYLGRYEGAQERRDEAYHQGTVWPWLIGPFVRAHLRVHRDPQAALALLEPLRLHLRDAGLGSVSEVCDGDAPHEPGGCPAQAWSVAAVLEALEAVAMATGAGAPSRRGKAGKPSA